MHSSIADFNMNKKLKKKVKVFLVKAKEKAVRATSKKYLVVARTEFIS